MDLAGPPAKAGGGSHHSRLLLQGSTPSELHLLDFINQDEMAIDELRIGQGPEMFRGLEFV